VPEDILSIVNFMKEYQIMTGMGNALIDLVLCHFVWVILVITQKGYEEHNVFWEWGI